MTPAQSLQESFVRDSTQWRVKGDGLRGSAVDHEKDGRRAHTVQQLGDLNDRLRMLQQDEIANMQYEVSYDKGVFKAEIEKERAAQEAKYQKFLAEQRKLEEAAQIRQEQDKKRAEAAAKAAEEQREAERRAAAKAKIQTQASKKVSNYDPHAERQRRSSKAEEAEAAEREAREKAEAEAREQEEKERTRRKSKEDAKAKASRFLSKMK